MESSKIFHSEVMQEELKTKVLSLRRSDDDESDKDSASEDPDTVSDL